MAKEGMADEDDFTKILDWFEIGLSYFKQRVSISRLNWHFSRPILSPDLGYCHVYVCEHTHCKMHRFIPVVIYLYTGNFTIPTVKSRYSHCFNCLKLFYENRQ